MCAMNLTVPFWILGLKMYAVTVSGSMSERNYSCPSQATAKNIRDIISHRNKDGGGFLDMIMLTYLKDAVFKGSDLVHQRAFQVGSLPRIQV